MRELNFCKEKIFWDWFHLAKTSLRCLDLRTRCVSLGDLEPEQPKLDLRGEERDEGSMYSRGQDRVSPGADGNVHTKPTGAKV